MLRTTIKIILLAVITLVHVQEAGTAESMVCFDRVERAQEQTLTDTSVTAAKVDWRKIELTSDAGTLLVLGAYRMEFRAKDGLVSRSSIPSHDIPLFHLAAVDRYGNFILGGEFASVYITIERSNGSARIADVILLDGLHSQFCFFLTAKLYGPNGCFSPGVHFNQALRLGFVLGYDWLERDVTHILQPEGEVPFLVENQNIQRVHDIPDAPAMLVRTTGDDLFLYDGSNFRDLRIRLIGKAFPQTSKARGDIFIHDDEKLVRLRADRTEVVPLPRSIYDDFGDYVALPDGRTIIGVVQRSALVIQDGKVQGVYEIPNLGSSIVGRVMDFPIANNRVPIELLDETESAGDRKDPTLHHTGELYLCSKTEN